jgi:hypothetical protein
VLACEAETLEQHRMAIPAMPQPPAGLSQENGSGEPPGSPRKHSGCRGLAGPLLVVERNAPMPTRKVADGVRSCRPGLWFAHSDGGRLPGS